MDEAGEALDRAGDRRFLLKSRWLSERIRVDGPDQALYQVLMEGLGYSSNRRPFVELASRAPYQAIAKLAVQSLRKIELRQSVVGSPPARGWPMRTYHAPGVSARP